MALEVETIDLPFYTVSFPTCKIAHIIRSICLHVVNTGACNARFLTGQRSRVAFLASPNFFSAKKQALIYLS